MQLAVNSLDKQINNFIGLQNIQGQSIFRRVKDSDFFVEMISAVPVFFKTVVYEEVPRSNQS